MLGERRIKEITDRILTLSEADQTEVVVLGTDSYLTRFANNIIHQNVSESNVEVRVRAVLGKRVGVASINSLADEALQKVVENAITVARFQPENPEFKSLPEPVPIPPAEGFVERTASYTPEQRARGVKAICDQAAAAGLNAAGAFSTAAREIAVANSLGIFAYHPSTLATLTTVIMGEDSSGYSFAASMNVDEIDPEALGREAVDKALRSRGPVEIEPGEYTVILEEYAVTDMLFILDYLGFSALAVQEGRSFMGGRFGEKIVGDNVTIWDDGRDPRTVVLPFDFEGVPKQRLELITSGVAKGVAYDTFTAGREEGKQSTGHALPAPNTSGPLPINLLMATGEATKEDMLRSTERGIWVTRFHYTNPVHPLKTVFTGMTRDGTFLIEHGEITRPLKNLRFTQSILEALSNVEMIGRESKLWVDDWSGLVGVRAPALKIARFNFTGVTEF